MNIHSIGPFLYRIPRQKGNNNVDHHIDICCAGVGSAYMISINLYQTLGKVSYYCQSIDNDKERRKKFKDGGRRGKASSNEEKPKCFTAF